MFKTITFVLLFISCTATFSSDNENTPDITSNSESSKSSKTKEANVRNEPSATQKPSQTKETDIEKDTVSGCSDPDLEMLGLDYMCK